MADPQPWRHLRLMATQDAASGNDTVLPPTEDPAELERRRKLVEGVLYSGPFILTYQWVLCGLVLLFTIWHWYGKWSSRRQWQLRGRAREPLEDTSSASSSGSSTPQELRRKADERTRLLDSGSEKTTNWLRGTARCVRALGMYQPPPLPLGNRIIPSNSTTLVVLLLAGLNIFYATYRINWDIDQTFVFSDRTARLFVANLPWLYLVAAKNQPLKFLTGHSYEGLNILHRRVGEWLCLLAIVHGASMMVVWYCIFGRNGMSLWTFLTHRIIVLGIAALICYEVLFVTSLKEFREWWYEVFLGCHIVLQAAGLVLVFFHHPGGRVYTAITLAIFLVDRLVFRFWLKSRTFRADLTVMEDGETVLVSADWPVVSRWTKLWTSLFGLDVRYGWKPTEHVFISVPAMSKKHVIQAHPFTIASAAPEGEGQHARLSLIMRAHDGFTRDLLNYAKNHFLAKVRLDGPYGSMHALEMLRYSDVSLLVVGGSGIAVAYPLLWTLLHTRDTEAAQRRRKVGVIWVIHDASHVDWIGHERLDELRGKGLHVCIPPPTSKAGRPDVGALVEASIKQLVHTGSVEDPRIGVVVSGPDGMNRAARNMCSRLAWQGRDIECCVEKYGW